MRDGAGLATDVYLPDAREAVPAVLVRLPYGRRSRYAFMDRCAPYFTDRGYALVVQDVRGTGDSDGPALPYVFEVHDGYDSIDWVVTQRWSDGSVGMFGDSYYGYTQWAALASRHPALKALVPRMASVPIPVPSLSDNEQLYLTPTDAGPGMVASDEGTARPPSLGWAMALATVWSGRGDEDLDVDLSEQPPLAAFDHAFERAGYRSAAFDATIPVHQLRPIFPDGHPFSAPPVPILHTLGWFDPIAKRGMNAFEVLSGREGWAPLQYLFADSVDHENYHLDDVPLSRSDDRGESEKALAEFLPRYVGPALDFFDAHLAGRTTAPTPRVRWHIGHVGYRSSESWPPKGVIERTLYLADLGIATTGTGRLADQPPATEQHATWIHDPSDPVIGGSNGFDAIFEYTDESPLSSRLDVLAFDSEPADVPHDLAGPVSVTLTLGSACGDLDACVQLLDVDPDGAAHRLLADQLWIDVADGPRSVTMELGHLGYRLRPGQRLRLHVAGSEYPSFLTHPGVTGANRWTQRYRGQNELVLITSPEAPAAIVLTVLPAGNDG